MNYKAKIKRIIIRIDKMLPRACYYTFIMSPKEKVLFDKRVKNSRFYLEFGMGGSTFRVLQKSQAIVYTIDSSTEWISLMREYRQISRMEKKGRLFLFHVDIGPTRVWGRPVDDQHKEKFPDYSSQIFKLIDKSKVDTILIDGRFRVACALKTILECYQNKNLQIIIHDFWNREDYHVLLKYFDSIDKVDSLGVFKIKSNIDLNKITEEYDRHKYNVE